MFAKSLQEVLFELMAAKGQLATATPSGFGRKHRAQVAAAQVQPGGLHTSRQQFRANERKRHKRNAAVTRGLTQQYAPHGTGCAGFHRSN